MELISFLSDRRGGYPSQGLGSRGLGFSPSGETGEGVCGSDLSPRPSQMGRGLIG